jgi:ribonuclease D
MVMMNNFNYFASIEDEYVRSLPVMSFPGIINLIDHPASYEKIKRALHDEKLLGFDTETKPCFKKGRYHPVALLQLSARDQAFLFRLNKVHIPGFIIDILEDEEIIKVGVAIKDDLNGLNKLVPFEPDGFVDLQQYVKQYGIEDNGLKKSQTSNWEQDDLTHEQLEYAATEAWVCRQMYEVLSNHNPINRLAES